MGFEIYVSVRVRTNYPPPQTELRVHVTQYTQKSYIRSYDGIMFLVAFSVI